MQYAELNLVKNTKLVLIQLEYSFFFSSNWLYVETFPMHCAYLYMHTSFTFAHLHIIQYTYIDSLSHKTLQSGNLATFPKTIIGYRSNENSYSILVLRRGSIELFCSIRKHVLFNFCLIYVRHNIHVYVDRRMYASIYVCVLGR